MRIVRAPAKDLRRRRGRSPAWLGRTWLALLAWRGWRRLPVGAPEIARIDFPAQTRGRGLRMTEWLRDRLRPNWLRVQRDDGRGDTRVSWG